MAHGPLMTIQTLKMSFWDVEESQIQISLKNSHLVPIYLILKIQISFWWRQCPSNKQTCSIIIKFIYPHLF